MRAAGAGIEQGGRGAHKVKRGQQLVELDGAALALQLVDGQPHGDPHEKALRQLDARLVLGVDEIPVVEGLQGQVGEALIPLWLQGPAQPGQVVLGQFFIQQFQFHRRFYVGLEAGRVALRHLRLGRLRGAALQVAQGLPAQVVQQQASGDIGVVWLFFNQRPRAHHQRRVDIGLLDSVEQIAQGVVCDETGFNMLQVGAGLLHQGREPPLVQLFQLALAGLHPEGVRRRGLTGFLLLVLLVAFAGPFLPVDDIGAGHLLLAVAHQGQFHLVLNVLDMHGAAAGHAPRQGLDHLFGEGPDFFMHAGGGRRGAALHIYEGLGDGQIDLGGVKTGDFAVAPDDLVLAWLVGAQVVGRRVAFQGVSPGGTGRRMDRFAIDGEFRRGSFFLLHFYPHHLVIAVSQTLRGV